MSLPAAVYVLGAASLLNDAASEMVVPLLPTFLTTTLGSGALALGVVEGAADTVAAVVKLYGGRVADRTQRHRALVVGGYGLSNLVRPLIAWSPGAAGVLGLRVVDRIGKGLRTSPRDALIGAVVAPEDRVRAYSVHRAMDHSGAILGSLLAWMILTFYTANLRTAILLSALPGALVVALVAFAVPRPAGPVKGAVTRLADIPVGLRGFLTAAGVLALGRASDTFLLLRAGEEDVAAGNLPLLWMLLHVVKVIASLGSGAVADRLGRRGTITAAWAVYAVIYGAFALVRGPTEVAACFVVYGLYHGLSEGAERALVADLVPAEARGTAFGWYHLVTGVLALPAGLLIGGLWTRFGAPVAFGTSAMLAAVALLLFRGQRATAAAG